MRTSRITVTLIATTEMVTPIYPMTSKPSSSCSLNSGGLGLSKRAKCVRWLQSQTVLEVEERLVFLVHPLLDHRPIASTELFIEKTIAINKYWGTKRTEEFLLASEQHFLCLKPFRHHKRPQSSKKSTTIVVHFL